MKILFYDVVTPSIYTEKTLLETGLGGTEATIVRVAHSLKNYHSIYVAQHCRSIDQEIISDGVHYITLETANKIHPDVVVLLRYSNWLEKVGNLFPKARLYFWLHNMPAKSLFQARNVLVRYGYQIIAVSEFHKQAITRRLKGKWYHRILSSNKCKGQIKVHMIYNPIANTLNSNETSWNPNQFFLASTPYKGLDQTLAMFQKVLEVFPDYELKVATYAKWDEETLLPRQVKFLGSLPHHTLLQHIRESFCVFYPQAVRCETFGLVFAESNAVGTPVLAHDFGAAREVLSSSAQLVDGNSIDSIISKIREWRAARPSVNGKAEFRLDKVTNDWMNLLSN